MYCKFQNDFTLPRRNDTRFVVKAYLFVSQVNINLLYIGQKDLLATYAHSNKGFCHVITNTVPNRYKKCFKICWNKI